MHFGWLEGLAILVNNPINYFLINPNIILYHVFFIKYVRISIILLVSKVVWSTENSYTHPFNPIFFMLLAPPEIFPKRKGYFLIWESVALNWYIFAVLTNKKCLAPAVNVVSSDYCVEPIPRMKISFLLLSICTDELMSTPKIMTFSPTLPSGNENSERESNTVP